MKIEKSREAFSTLTAIVVMVLMATVAVLVFNLSGKMVKGTTTQFHREQAILLAKSYTEYAVMAITANDRNASGGNCLTDINATNIIRDISQSGYQAQVHISYIGDAQVTPCGAANVLSDTVVTPETPLNTVIDVYIQYKDMDHHEPNIGGRPWITYHKRTLQKI